MMMPGYNITDLVQEAQIRWLKPGEVLFILQNFEEKQLINEPPQKPPSGSLFLFDKRVLRFFRKDGHNWRIKKDGRTVGEAHERLKVGNVEALSCYYAHGELNPNFQRRCYWMLDQGMDHIVLVHYRDITVLQQTELYRSSADIEAETAAVNGISKLNLVTNDDPSLKDTLAAVRNATQAAARIQSAFRAHSFRKRQQKDSYVSGDEYGILLSDIEGLSAASKLNFRNGNYNNAALSIQKKFRAWKGRKDFLALRQKVVTVQAHVRGHQVRKNYKVFCWAVGVVEKIVLRWRRKGVGLRGYKQELAAVDESEDEAILKVFRKEKVDVSINEAVSRVLSMVDSQPARQQYRRMLQKYRQAKSYTLEAVLFATNNFSHENLITESPLGKVYRGQTENLVIQRLDSKYGQGNELQTEILTLKRLEHKNIASFFAYWVENNENIIIYEASQGTLNQHLSDPTLTWSQRLQICIGVARALNHIHSDIIHCDINSSKIILDENWEPKIYGFELSTKYPRSWRHRLLLSHHFDTNNLTPKYDVYSFGVLLLEVLCGRKPMITKDGIEEELEEIIDPSLRTQMDTQALALFTNIAYKCLNQQHVHRPTMDQIIKELEDVLELQWEHTKFKGHSVALAADEDTPFNILKISLREIRQATNGFNKACFVGSGGYADVYRAKLDFLNTDGLLSMEGKSKDKLPKISKTVAIKRISSRVDEQGKQGFLTELELLTRCKHPNIVSLLGFCRELGEMILVYEYAFKGSLADYLISSDKTTVILPWVQRIKICLDIAHGISYLHSDTEAKPRIIHRDIKSDNILLDENMNAKLADFGLSKSHPMNQQPSTIYSKNVAGTTIYMDPEYLSTGKYKRESDIYSFGVVLFEVLSGRVAYDSIYTSESDLGLAPIARRRFNEGTLQELIDPKIIEEDDDDHIFTLNRGPNQDSFHTFSKIAYQCLAETQANRPTINTVIKELQNALEVQGETVVLSRSRLTDIVLATENFAESYCIGLDTIGTVYKAELDHFSNNNSLASKRKYNGEPSKKRITVAIKRITCRDGGQGKQEFFEEIEMRTSYQHPNIVPLLGFCNEGDEMILVYESVAERSLNDYFKSVDKMYTFTWSQRLYMCLDIARGLDHLHTKIANPQRIIHVDIKSANILLDKNRGAKIGYFVTSELRTLANEEIGMKVYKDPEYETEGKPKENSDVYSFGVILFEIFCGRLAYDPVYIVENDEGLASIVRQRFDDGTIESMMDPKLKEETDEDINTSNRGPNKDSLATFLNIAYQCLEEAAMRPNMRLVIKELEKAIDYHMG